jgi:hypothetical protein
VIKKSGLVIMYLFLSVLLNKSCAQEINHKLASVFVYNFTKYIDWPADHKTGDFIIAVVGESPITNEFNKVISTKKVGNQYISVKVTNTLEGIENCNIIFLPAAQSYRLKEIIASLKGKPILIICEKPGLAKKGAGINLFLDEDDDYKTKFEINKKAIENAGLLLSNQLINLAEIVY